jgi:hypothetical protein
MAKIPVGIRVEEEQVERLKNAVWHLGKGLTITGVIVQAIEKRLMELETRNNGKPFPQRRGRIAKSPVPFNLR